MNFRGMGGIGALGIGLIIIGMIIYMSSCGQTTIIRYIGDNYTYRGSFSDGGVTDDGVDIFVSPLETANVKIDIESYLAPYMPAKLNNKIQYIMNYKDCVVVISPSDIFNTESVSLNSTDKTVIAIYSPYAAKKQYNDHQNYVYIHSSYRPYYYRRYRHRYVSLHFHPGYRKRYRIQRRKFRFSSRSSGRRGRGRSSSGYRGGGRSWGK